MFLCVLFLTETHPVVRLPDAAGTPGVSGATYRHTPLMHIYREIQKDRLERSWRRDADKVFVTVSIIVPQLVIEPCNSLGSRFTRNLRRTDSA